MAHEKIIEKLYRELEKDMHEECHVVYILSRIRKCLEIKNQINQYKYLNFYCNWALHSKINRTRAVEGMLQDFISGNDYGPFLFFSPLFKDLENFLNANNLPRKILEDHNSFSRFKSILIDIYSDTPLEIYSKEKRTVVVTIRKEEEKGYEKVFPFSIDINYKN